MAEIIEFTKRKRPNGFYEQFFSNVLAIVNIGYRELKETKMADIKDSMLQKQFTNIYKKDISSWGNSEQEKYAKNLVPLLDQEDNMKIFFDVATYTIMVHQNKEVLMVPMDMMKEILSGIENTEITYLEFPSYVPLLIHPDYLQKLKGMEVGSPLFRLVEETMYHINPDCKLSTNLDCSLRMLDDYKRSEQDVDNKNGLFHKGRKTLDSIEYDLMENIEILKNLNVNLDPYDSFDFSKIHQFKILGESKCKEFIQIMDIINESKDGVLEKLEKVQNTVFLYEQMLKESVVGKRR